MNWFEDPGVAAHLLICFLFMPKWS